MQDDITIGMGLEGLGKGDTHTTQHEMITLGEGVHIVALPYTYAHERLLR